VPHPAATEHPDTYEHNGYEIHTVVTPGDCRICHVQEAEQYSRNIMAHAYKNLAENKVYNDLENTILGGLERKNGRIAIQPATPPPGPRPAITAMGLS